MSKLIGKQVECKDRPRETGIITWYDSYTGELNIQYENGEIHITHISKCKVVKETVLID